MFSKKSLDCANRLRFIHNFTFNDERPAGAHARIRYGDNIITRAFGPLLRSPHKKTLAEGFDKRFFMDVQHILFAAAFRFGCATALFLLFRRFRSVFLNRARARFLLFGAVFLDRATA